VQSAQNGAQRRYIALVARSAGDETPERHRVTFYGEWLIDVVRLGRREVVIREPVGNVDLFDRVGPVAHRAGDPHDDIVSRQVEQGILTKPHQAGPSGVEFSGCAGSAHRVPGRSGTE
jgi:hypothetical protein